MKLGGKGRIASIQTGEIDFSKNGKATTIAELKLKARNRQGAEREPEVFNMKTTQEENVNRSGEAVAKAFMQRQYGKSERQSEELLSRFPLENEPPEGFSPPPLTQSPTPEDIKVIQPEASKPKPSIFYMGEGLRLNKKTPMPKELGAHAKRLPLLSKGLYNDFDHVFIRPLAFTEFCYLQAAMESKDEGAILDVFDLVMSENVRELVNKDFIYIQYWLRLNSLPSTPINLTWTSMYGNKNSYPLKDSSLQANITDKTIEDRNHYPEFSFPTVGDREAFKIAVSQMEAEGKNPAAFTALVKKAQYLSGASLEEKIEKAKNMPPEVLFTKLPKFIKEFSDFGVNESFSATDSYFNADEALEVLGFKTAAIEERLDTIEEQDSYRERDIIELKSLQADFVEEIARIKKELQTTGEAAPKSETRTFSFDLADFFPEV